MEFYDWWRAGNGRKNTMCTFTSTERLCEYVWNAAQKAAEEQFTSTNTASTQLIAGLISVVQKYGWNSKESLDYYYEHLREAINSAHC